MKESKAGLVGHYFHSLRKDNGKVEWYGVVVANPEPRWYLVQTYSWLDGNPYMEQLVKIDDMAGWLFYADSDAMHHSLKSGAARKLVA
jgi:hypothetical protein